MRRHLTRNFLAVIAGLLAVPLLGFSVAWACTALATLDLDHKSGAVVGDVVKGTGTGFDVAPTSSQVEVRLNGREGPLLATARADINGRIAFEFTTPQAAPGDYVVVATQTNAQGQPRSGTPARAPFTILESNPAPAQPAPAAPAEQPAPPAQQPAPAVPAAPAQQAAQPAPAVQAPAERAGEPAAAVPPAPAEVVAPAPAQAPAVADDRRVTMTPAEQSLALPLIMVAVGLLLTVGSGAAVLASRRRDAQAEAQARR